VLFLAVVKNKKLHHFVRFNCMQAIMLDIVIMLCHIVKAYLPAEIKWSVIAHLVDMGMWTTCMGTVCVDRVVVVGYLGCGGVLRLTCRAALAHFVRSCMRCSGR
jgi:uncharacterized membrane protein